MKKLSFIVMAGLLALGLTQCKKNEPTTNDNADNGNRVSITLKLDNGGQRVHPEEENGIANVVYDNGDVVLVGSAGKYMGSLTYNGTLFTGSINAEATEGQPLQFVFLGGQSISGLTENASTECTFSLGDQSNGLAVISCAPSNENFSATNLSYTAYLRNKCALVKFSLGETSADAAISLTGVKNSATIGFDGTVTNGTTTGNIVTYGTGATRYAVVLSDQGAVTKGTISAEGYEGTFSIPTAAYTNAFLTDATMTLTAAVPAPEGAIDGKFSINDDGDQVYFSKGNLQYTKSTGVWSFMEHQYDMVETMDQYVGNDYEEQDVVSLFGWGTSGYNHGATCYQPWSTSTNKSDYYAYGNSGKNLFDAKDDGSMQGQADWGYNAISNGGNTENSGWRTLRGLEWVYIFRSRTTSSGIRFAKATVNGVSGVIILPDNWTKSTYPLNNANGGTYDSNTINAEDWANTLEANGAVFLPAAGCRYEYSIRDVGFYGGYWSSSNVDGLGLGAYYANFRTNILSGGDLGDFNTGLSVRLVRSCQ